jgi:O-antigen/teichoic acid export membrane protein
MDEFGLYMLILAVVHGMRIFAGLGLDLTLVQLISATDKDENRYEIFSTILLVRVIAALLIGSIVYAFAHFAVSLFDASIQSYIIYLPFLCFLSSLKELLFFYFQGLYLFKRHALINVLSATSKVVLIYIFILENNLDLQKLIHVEVVALAACLGVQFLALPFKTFSRIRFDARTFKRVIGFGFPLYLNNLLTFVYQRANVFIIGALLNPVSIALYEVATKIPEGMHRLFSAFIAVYFPSLTRLFSDKKNAAAEAVMNKCLTFLSSGSMFLALCAFLFSEQIMNLLFSREYLQAAPAFALLMVNLQITIVSYTMGYSLVSAGYSSLPVKINIIASILNIIASLLLIPVYGFIGAAVSSLIMNATATFMNYYHLRKARIALRLTKYFVPLFFFLIIAGVSRLGEIVSIYPKIVLIGLYAVGCLICYQELRSIIRLS